MSILEVIIYSLIFSGLAIFLGLRAIRWYKYNVGMVFKKKFALYGAIVVVIAFLIFIIATL